MLVELVYSLNAGLEDGTIGLNAQFDTLSVVSGHAVPPDVTFYNQIEHKWVARRKVTTEDTGVSYPAVAIFQSAPGSVDGEVETIVRDGDWPITFAYLAKRSDSALGARDGGYTMRCLPRFLRDYMENSNVAARTVNGIIVSQIIGDLQVPPILEEWDKAEIVAALTATFRCRETSP